MNNVIFKGKRIDNNEVVEGHYFETPLTAENFQSADGKDFFDSGLDRKRPCISQDGVVYEVDPDTVTVGDYILG